MISRESRNLYDPGRQQRFGPLRISAPIVMKRRSYLYDSLQKSFFWFGFNQPHFFPHFVRFKKLARIEVCQPALEFFFLLAGFHRALVCFPLEFR